MLVSPNDRNISRVTSLVVQDTTPLIGIQDERDENFEAYVLLDIVAQPLSGCTIPVPISIDIKPGSYPNSINLSSKGVVPVAIITTPGFDAGTVDIDTVKFADASPLRSGLEDVDGDGDIDMILHFDTQALKLDRTSTSARLTALTTGGTPIEGTDSLRIIPSRR